MPLLPQKRNKRYEEIKSNVQRFSLHQYYTMPDGGDMRSAFGVHFS